MMLALILFSIAPGFLITSVSAQGDIGYITLDDTTTYLHFYAGPPHGGTTPDAWAYPDIDIWYLTIATSYEAKVRIEWFDWYPTNDVYELWIDGEFKGTNAAGGTGVVEEWLSTGNVYEVKIVWIYYQTDKPIIGGGSYYDITFEVLEQRLKIEASDGWIRNILTYENPVPTESKFETEVNFDANGVLQGGEAGVEVKAMGSVEIELKAEWEITEDWTGRFGTQLYLNGEGTMWVLTIDGDTEAVLDIEITSVRIFIMILSQGDTLDLGGNSDYDYAGTGYTFWLRDLDINKLEN